MTKRPADPDNLDQMFEKELEKQEKEAVKSLVGYDTFEQFEATQEAKAICESLEGYGREWASGVILTPEDLRNHCWIIGTTQFGKSRFLQHNIQQDILEGKGLLCIDPQGNLTNRLLRFCAEHDVRRVCIIDPNPPLVNGKRYYASFNPLTLYEGEQAYFRASLVADAMAVAFGERPADTPRLTRFFTDILLILSATQNTLLEARHFFYKNDETKELIFDEGILKNQLHKQMGAYQDLKQLYDLPPLQVDSKLESTQNRLPFTDIPGMQYILGPGEPDLCFDDLIAEKFVILVKLNPGTLTARFDEMKALGSIVLNSVLVTKPQELFPIYVDEIGDFGTAKLMQVLRKGLQENFVSYLAHQTIPQLDKSLFETIAATCQNKVVFRLPNPNDLHFISRSIQYPQDSSVLLNLDEQWAAIKTIHDPVRVCQIVTVPDLPERDISDYLQSLYNDYEWYLNESTAKALIHTRRSPDKPTSSGRRKVFRFKKPDK